MKLTVTIQGREAIPVRAIPYIAGEYLTTERLVQMLAHEPLRMELYNKSPGIKLSAFSWENGVLYPILPREWDDLLEEIRKLEKQALTYAQIQQLATTPGLSSVTRLPEQAASLSNVIDAAIKKQQDMIPAGVFVWLHEFEETHRRAFGDGPLAAMQLLNDGETPRPGDRALNYSPLRVRNDKRLYRWVMEEGVKAEASAPPGRAGKDAPPVPKNTGDTEEGNAQTKPWLNADPKDPKPEQNWYTPARYFARELVKRDTSLLLKRPILAGKVALSLAKVGIYKRGGKKPLLGVTVLKAFANISLE